MARSSAQIADFQAPPFIDEPENVLKFDRNTNAISVHTWLHRIELLAKTDDDDDDDDDDDGRGDADLRVEVMLIYGTREC